MWRLLFFDKNNGDKFSTEKPEEDLMTLLIEKTKALGHMLTFAEASTDPEMVRPNSYAYYFNSFREAADIAWRRINLLNGESSGSTKQGCRAAKTFEQIRQTTEEPCRREVNWMSESQEKKPRSKNTRYTIEEAKKSLIDFYNRSGKLPSQKDAQKYDSGLPSWPTLVKILGPKSGWPAIIGETTEISSTVADTTEDASTPQEAIIEETFSEDITENASEDVNSGEVLETAPIDVNSGETAETATATKGEEEKTVVLQCGDDDIEVETVRQEQNDFATFDIKITLPGREKPIFITLTV